MIRAGASIVTVALVAAVTAGLVPAEEVPETIGFTRVHVPRDRLSDVPLGDGRYVPMPAAEFEAAVSRLAGGRSGMPLMLAAAARYEAVVDERGVLAGGLSFDVTAQALPAASMPLGVIHVRSGTVRSGDGVGEAVLFGLPDGGIAVRTPGPGTYNCDFSCPSPGGGGPLLPLLPSLATIVVLRLPEEARPIVLGAVQSLVVPPAAGPAEDGRVTWRVEVGAGTDAVIRIVPRVQETPRLAVWTEVAIEGQQAEITAAVQPSRPWTPGTLTLGKDAALRVTTVRIAGMEPLVWRETDDGLSIDLPPALTGSEQPMHVTGVAPIAAAAPATLPTVRPAAPRWGGGGLALVVAPPFVVEATALDEACVVTPLVASRWPLPARAAPPAVRLFFEQQSARGAVAVTLQPRVPRFESARVTTVELSPGTVLGRAACDVRVVAGAAFAINADVLPGWFIDSVEVGEWDDGGGGFVPSAVDRILDWRLVRSPGGAELRVGLATAATADRRLGLRIVGHRAGVPLGGTFVAGDMDMVRLAGESPDSVLVDFRVPAQADVEIDGGPVDVVPVNAGLTALVEPGSPRGRISGGVRAARGEARLVARRPPLDARVQVRLVAREGRLSETFTLECLPSSGMLDSLIVDFSEPIGDAVEWSLLQPAAATIGARRLEPADTVRNEVAREDGVAESWLVEVRPAVPGPVTIRASRTAPFDEAVPVPLAWVEGASLLHGTVLVRGDAGPRPTLVNRRLRELPPAVGTVDEAAATVAEFAYGDPRSMAIGSDPAAEIAPNATTESRAWAWRESITCWCHDSGRTESETIFDLENHGRESLTLTVPGGLTLEDVSIDGLTAPLDGIGPAGGDIRLTLPPGLRRTRVAVRGTTDANSRPGAWRVAESGCAVDVPVLERQTRVMLPPELELVLPTGLSQASTGDWAQRLFNAVPRVHDRAGPVTRTGERMAVGFRELLIDPMYRVNASGFIVVRRRLVTSLAILAWLVATAGGLALARWRVGAGVGGCIVAAIAALWLPPPFDIVVRAAWWGLLGAAVVAFWRRVGTPAAFGLAIMVSIVAPHARATEPLRVFVTPGAEGTAFVPEPLFRLLSARQAALAAAVRVANCRIVAGAPGPDASWRMVLDVEAEQAGGLLIDQSACGATWGAATAGPGSTVEIQKDGAVARLVVGPGRHRVELSVLPAVERRGAVEEASVCLPPTPAAELELADPGSAGLPADRAWQCESMTTEGAWRRVPMRAGAARLAYDVSRSGRLRLVRPVDPSDALVDTVRDATSANDVAWLSDVCRVTAAFEVGAGREIVRSVVVLADAGLEPGAAGAAVVTPLGGGRFAIELPEPRPGRRRVEIDFAMPLVDAVGVFDVPGVWLESVANDERTVRLSAAGDLDVTAEPPGGASLVRPRDDDAPGTVAQWRFDAVTTAENRAPVPRGDGRVGPGARQRASITVHRRQQPPRTTQRLAVEFASDHVGLRLQCQCDAGDGPLLDVPLDVPPAAVIDRVAVWEEQQGPADRAALEAMDVAVSRPTPGRMVVVMQQPRAGRFRLEADLRIPFRSAARGRLPLARVTSAGTAPLLVAWRAAPDLVVTLSDARETEQAAGEARTQWELAASDNPPDFVLERRVAPAAADEAPAAAADGDEPANTADAAPQRVDEVALASIHLAIDGRGRAWGLVRFDLATSEPRLRLRLPPGLRLFDLLVDGRAAVAVPDGDAWDVRLHDVRWPRSLLAVVAGDVGGGRADGAPVRLEPPRLEGLPCHTVLWTIDAPGHLALRLAAPAQLLDATAWKAAATSARSRLNWFVEAVDAGGDESQRRLPDFAALRSAGGMPALEDAWERSLDGASSGSLSNRIHALASDGGGLTMRAVRRSDPGAALRGLVTLGLMALAAGGWIVAGRLPAWWLEHGPRLVPWGLMGAGLAWLLVLVPALPGWILIGAGVAAVIAARRRVAVPDIASFDSTRTFLAR
ncbi:MAG: hypothetical protein DWI03_06565 [Planctomycetota bacterium]|nr:MAG: hypothetical protein DWI03_06565 [Planctomycetota bacterium]